MSKALEAGGQITVTEADGTVRHFDTFTCAHGNEIVKVLPGMISQAPFCRKCMKPICKRCAAIAHNSLEHMPIERWLDAKERPNSSAFARAVNAEELRLAIRPPR